MTWAEQDLAQARRHYNRVRESGKPVDEFWESNGYHMHGDPWKEERHDW